MRETDADGLQRKSGLPVSRKAGSGADGENQGDSASPLNRLLDNLPGMAYRCIDDARWTMRFVSLGSLVLTGYPAEMLTCETGLSYLDLVHPEDREHVRLGVQAAMNEGTAFRLTYRIVTAGKDIKWVSEQGRAVHADSGKPEGREGFISDITERMASEQALRDSEQRSRIGAEELARQGETLTTITESLAAYVEQADWKSAFSRLLRGALTQTQSEYGFIGVVVNGQKLRVLAFEGIVWDEVVNREFYDKAMATYQENGYIVFENFNNLFGRAITTGEVMIANQPDQHAHSAGRPTGHPPMRNFMGIPIHGGQQVCGVVALANRPGGYTEKEQHCIETLVKYAGGMCVSYRERELAQELEREREHDREALRESEKRYSVLFEASPVPMWVFDEETRRFLAVNRAATVEYGYSEAEFLNMTLYDLRTEVNHALLDKVLALGPADRTQTAAARVPVAHRRKDGSEFSVLPISRYVMYADRPARFVAAFDVSAQVKAEKDLQDHLFTLQRSADAAQAITQHQTLDTTMQEVADQARGVIGTHQAVVSVTQGDNWAQAVTSLSLSEKYAAWRGYPEKADGSGIYAMVCETNRPVRLTQQELEAHPLWRSFRAHQPMHPPMQGWLAVPLTGSDGRNIGLLQLSDKYEGEFSLQDEYVAVELAQLASIAIENARLFEQVRQLNASLEVKVAERTAALSRQEALFRALAEQAPEMVWNVDVTGQLTYINRRWFDMMGGTAEDWLGLKWLEAVHPDDRDEVAANWKRSSESGALYTGIRRLQAKDGSYRTMSYRASPVLDENGDIAFWVGIDADITDIKAAETALRLSNHELEAFSYSVSHDLRSPLNTVAGFSSLLARNLGPNANEKALHYLSRIQAGVVQMGELIEGLLALSQVSRTALTQDAVDLSELAHEILERHQAREPARVVEIDIQEGLSAQGDAHLLRAAMENLLGNAWKFSSQRKVTEIKVGQLEGGDAFYVRDNGAGFDMAYSDKLFGTFQRLHCVSEFPGTGVGLATVSRIIARHGGRIWASASPGKGATFFFTLPGALNDSAFGALH
ncbi:MAG: PAS domain S-box protein [Polaromonas sp.]